MRTAPLLSVALCLFAAAPAETIGNDKHPPPAPKVAATAWGKPVGGLQLGIFAWPHDPRSTATMELGIVVRNVGQADAEVYEPLGLYFRGKSDAGTVAAQPAFAYGGFSQPGAYFVPTVGPGKTHTFQGGLRVVRSAADSALGHGTELPPGSYRVGVDRFELRVGKQKTIELGTGYLDVEIPPEKK